MWIIAAYVIALHVLCAHLIWRAVKHRLPKRLDGNVIIGDSLARGLPMKGANCAISGATTAEVLAALPNLSRAKHVYVLVGTNDLLYQEPVVDRLHALASRLPANVTWTGIPQSRLIDAAKIDEANAAIRTICTSRGFRFIPPPEGHTRDGLHLSAAAYAQWLEHLGH